jgi:hypothetical protein
MEDLFCRASFLLVRETSWNEFFYNEEHLFHKWAFNGKHVCIRINVNIKGWSSIWNFRLFLKAFTKFLPNIFFNKTFVYKFVGLLNIVKRPNHFAHHNFLVDDVTKVEKGGKNKSIVQSSEVT